MSSVIWPKSLSIVPLGVSPIAGRRNAGARAILPPGWRRFGYGNGEHKKTPRATEGLKAAPFSRQSAAEPHAFQPPTPPTEKREDRPPAAGSEPPDCGGETRSVCRDFRHHALRGARRFDLPHGQSAAGK